MNAIFGYVAPTSREAKNFSVGRKIATLISVAVLTSYIMLVLMIWGFQPEHLPPVLFFLGLDEGIYVLFFFLLIFFSVFTVCLFLYAQIFMYKKTSIGIVLFLIVGLFGFSMFFFVPKVADELKSPYAIMLSALFATLGWMAQYYNTRRLHVRQATAQRVQEFRNSKTYREHLLSVKDYFSKPVSQNEYEEEIIKGALENENNGSLTYTDNNKAYEIKIAVVEMMNFFDDLAYSVKCSQIDEEEIYNTISGHMIPFEQEVRGALRYYWGLHYTYGENLRWLINYWKWNREENSISQFDISGSAVDPQEWRSYYWYEGETRLKHRSMSEL